VKIRLRSSKPKVRLRVSDRTRSQRLSTALLHASEKKRRKELAERGKNRSETPKKTVNVTVIPPKTEGNKTTVKVSMPLNRAGNMRGMHNAGESEQMQKVRAMRKIYNKQMPVPQCNNCAFSQTCPKFRAGFECAFLPFLGAHGVDTPKDLMEYMKDLVASNFRRAQMATALETLSGGAPSLELSESLMMLFNMTRDLAEFMREEEDKAGTLDLETNDKSVIGKLFGGMDNLLGQTKNAIDNPLDNTKIGEEEDEDDKLGDGFDNLNDMVDHEVMSDYDKTESAKLSKKKKKKGDSTPGDILQSLLKKAA
jgi:hypothetical protein